jgi:hypothetical protein
MSNGYLLAAAADLAAAHEIAEGFNLDVIDASSVGDQQATSAALAAAANVGLILSEDAARDETFVALLGGLAARLERAQLILVTPDARAAFGFLPTSWPAMSLDEARIRSSELLRRRQAETGPGEETTRAEPLPPTGDVEPRPAPGSEQAAPQDEAAAPPNAAPEPPADLEQAPAASEDLLGGVQEDVDATPQSEDVGAGEEAEAPPSPAEAEAPPPVAAEPSPAPAPSEPPTAPPHVDAPHAPPQPTPTAPPARRAEPSAPSVTRSGAAAPSAPADATAFAPNKLRRGTPELVRIVVHQPKDLNAVIRAAKKLDPRTEPAPQGMNIGDVALGSSIGVALEVRGGACDGALQRRTWVGEPIDFNFAVEADASVKQVVMLARVFIDDAQIGVLAFTRKVSGPAKKPHGLGDRARLRRHKRVFLSYSSRDRETVSAIATAYQMAGVEHFWDRSSLKSGEEWHPRLRREIDRADLFHLCWSKAAADSEWVHKEAEHALTRRRKHSGKPEITVQMLDGPPWAPHPAELDAINFDDFVRAAIVGYARGDSA